MPRNHESGTYYIATYRGLLVGFWGGDPPSYTTEVSKAIAFNVRKHADSLCDLFSRATGIAALVIEITD